MIVREFNEDVGVSMGSAEAILSDILICFSAKLKVVLMLLKEYLNDWILIQHSSTYYYWRQDKDLLVWHDNKAKKFTKINKKNQDLAHRFHTLSRCIMNFFQNVEQLIKITIYKLCHSPKETRFMSKQFMSLNFSKIAPQAPHSPDSSPCDIFMFSRLKKPIPGTKLDLYIVEPIKQKRREC